MFTKEALLEMAATAPRRDDRAWAAGMLEQQHGIKVNLDDEARRERQMLRNRSAREGG